MVKLAAVPVMRAPKRPPNLNQLLQPVLKDASRLGSVLAQGKPVAASGKYVHWDSIQFLDGPRGLSKDDWWVALKVARQGQLRSFPLRDASDRCFQLMMPDAAIEYLHHIDQDAGGAMEAFDEGMPNPNTRDRYLVHSLIEEAITSSQLEGATSTRQVAKEMIRTGRLPIGKSEQMILNNYEAMSLIRERVDRPLSKELVFELHTRLTQRTLHDESSSGRFRFPDEEIRVYDDLAENIVHDPPPAAQLPERMRAMCDFANGATPDFFVHPVVRAIVLHFWLSYDHPFVDGNGRCARTLFYWLMLKQDYRLCEFISISQVIKKAPAKYARAFLYTETDDLDLTYFVLYHLRLLRRAIDELRRYIKRTRSAVHKAEALLKGSTFELNHRQLALLSHALRHPDARYSVLAHQRSHDVVYQTARADLLSLTDAGLLDKRKVGKRFQFSPPVDLADRLRRVGG